MKKPFVTTLMDNPISGSEIESRSFEQIDVEAPQHNFTPQQWKVVQRMIHTVADFSIIDDIVFQNNAIEAGIKALRNMSAIFCDSNMIRSGISVATIAKTNPDFSRDNIHCYVADQEVAQLAKENSLPRSLYNTRKAKPILDGSIALFGNAPVALLELNRMIMEDGIRPALVIGMPVGFVHVVESKQELSTLDVPAILLNGRRGGSTLAVAALNAIARML